MLVKKYASWLKPSITFCWTCFTLLVAPSLSAQGENLVPVRATAKALSTAEITTRLNDLSSWSDISEFRSYFLLLPRKIDLKQGTAALAQAAGDNRVFDFAPYQLTDNRMVLKLEKTDHPTGGAGPLNAAYNAQLNHLFDTNSGGDPRDSICVLMDGFGTPEYVRAAEIFQDYFIGGLVTRLVLGQYARQWAAADPAMNAQMVNFTDSVNAPTLDDFSHKITFKYVLGVPQKLLSLDESIAAEFSIFPIGPPAIMWGWRAGEKLDALLGGKDERYRTDVMDLLKSRISPYQAGILVGFTLDYMNGFVRNSHVAKLSPNSTPETDLTAIAKNLGSDPKVVEVRDLISNLHRMMTLELYSFVQAQPAALNAQKRLEVAAVQLAFLDGFEVGSLNAADEVFNQTFQIAYTAGFENGWRFGYEQGYAAGWTGGYLQGYGQAWQKANAMMSSLQATAKSSPSLETIVQDAQTAATVIAALFG